MQKLKYSGTAQRPHEPLAKTVKKCLVPTQKGIELIEKVPIETLKSPELTGEWESKLSKMARNEYPREQFMAEARQFLASMTEILKGVAKSMPDRKTHSTIEIEEPCPKCGSSLKLKTWDGKFYVACSREKCSADTTCYFRFDTDEKGGPIHTCKECNGRQYTTKGGAKVCADCGKWEDSTKDAKTLGGMQKQQKNCKKSGKNANDAGNVKKNGKNRTKKDADDNYVSAGSDACPKCRKGFLQTKEGQYGPFKACSARCGLIYSIDSQGAPAGGICKHCDGPRKTTKSGKAICLLCEKWSDSSK